MFLLRPCLVLIFWIGIQQGFCQYLYRVEVAQQVQQSELWLDFMITLAGGTGSLYLGMANFSVYVTGSNLNVSSVVLDLPTKGPWDAVTDPDNYNLMSFGMNSTNGYVNISVNANTLGPGPGQAITTTPTRIGRLKIPITNPAGFNTLTWRLNPMGVYNFNNQSIKSQGQFVNPAPNFPLCSIPNPPAITANQLQIAPGDSATLTASYPSCAWFLNGNLIPNQNSSTLVATQPGYYTAKATYYSCESSYGDTIILTALCNIDSTFTGALFSCQNQHTQYQANSLGLNYLWTVVGGSFVTGNNTATVVVNWGNQPIGSISLTVFDSLCSATDTQNVVLAGDSPDPLLSLNAQNQLQASVSSQIQWFLNGQLIPGANQDTLTPTVPGNYFVITGNGCDTDTSNTIAYVPTSQITLHQPEIRVYPNPFFEETTVFMELQSSQNISLTMLNALGQCVRKITNGRYSAGNYRFPINADGYQLTEGLFWIKLTTDNFEQHFPIIFTRK